MKARAAGILAHPTSLPGPGACGTLGVGCRAFVDWLDAAGCRLWQVLPLNPPGGAFSPYASPGVLVGSTHLASIEDLVAEGLLSLHEVPDAPATPRVDAELHQAWHRPLLERAARRLLEVDRKTVDAWADARPHVRSWALFRALDQEHQGGWDQFAKPLRRRQKKALQDAQARHQDAIDVEIAAQHLFWTQWRRLRDYAHARGVSLVGDMPIFVAAHGADTWEHRDLFTMDEDGAIELFTGAPPDYFSENGQFWGNPQYAWDRHEATGFQWWVTRLQATLELVDLVRIDHFRGFAASWSIGRDAGGDARKGTWRPAPGEALFTRARDALGDLPVIAEDLGHITPDVHALRDHFGFPGMRVLQFGFGARRDNEHLPHTFEGRSWAAYTGTHDNDTSQGWYQQAPEEARHHYRVYAGRDGSEPHWDLMRLAWGSVARFAIAPLQDVLGLGNDARMNVPGTTVGNWTWRAAALPWESAGRLRDLSQVYGRLPEPDPQP